MNTCKLRPTVFIKEYPNQAKCIGPNYLQMYFMADAFYFYGIEIGLFGRGVFIGFKKVCR